MFGVTGRLALCVYGADWALLYLWLFFILMIGVTGRLALRICVYGADWALHYLWLFFILMIGVTGRLALRVYGADWALLYLWFFFWLMFGAKVAWHFVCTGLIGHYFILMITLYTYYDWCHRSPGTLLYMVWLDTTVHILVWWCYMLILATVYYMWICLTFEYFL